MAEPTTAPATDTPRGVSIHEAAAIMDSRMASGAYTPTRATSAPYAAAGGGSDQADTPDDAKSPSAPPHEPVPGQADEGAQSDEMNTHSRPDTPSPDDDVDQGEDEGEEEAPEEKADADEESAEGYIEDADGNRIPIADAVRAYKRFNDLQARVTRKEQVLADERRTFQGQAQEVETVLAHRARAVLEREQLAEQKISQADQLLAQMAEGLSSVDDQFRNVDWARLEAEQPGEYLLLSEKYRRHQDNRREIEARREALAREKAEQEQRAQAAQYARLQHHLRTRYADMLSDPQRTQRMSDAMLGLARELGYSEQEISQTLDTRAWDLWHMAANYALLMQERNRALQGQARPENGKAEPQRIKVVRPNAPKPRALTQERAQLGSAYAAFQKNPSRENAIRAMEARQRYNGASSAR